uniref:Bicaudal D-related protein homolog n=1 Tax=Cacopsylla melanoneura TaxID=428564 RepID=A0A8D9EH15_9HEMI
MYTLDDNNSYSKHTKTNKTKAKMKPKYELEDYIYDVESRSLEPSADPEDIYGQLQQKEKDLILAAELGKALLEKNEELSRHNERLAEEYSQKLEEIEQDRHLLRRKLLSTQSECDSRLLELQSDIRELQNAVDERENALKQTEKEKTLLIAELTEQNQRLQIQIKESSKTEEILTSQLQGLRDQCNLRKSSLQDHQSSLEVLREEMQFLSEKKSELERRVQQISSEREQLVATLEEASDRVMMLERHSREQEVQVRVSQRELDELKSVNSSLGARLEALGSSHYNNDTQRRSLHAEMECDDANIPEGDELHQIKKEIVRVHERVRALCQQLKMRAEMGSGAPTTTMTQTEPVTLHQVKVGLLTAVIQDLCDLVHELSGGDYSTSSVSVTEMEIDLHRARETIDRMNKEIEEKREEIKRKTETIMELTSKLSVRESELAGAREERDRARADLQDLGGLARDEMVRKAWETRDGAVARKNATQVELARTRIDVLQANSQLMEAIQQKVELSQQLEQWQMDMQALLDEQMRRKLTNQEPGSGQESPVSAEKKRQSKRSLFSGLFQR